MRNVDFSKTHVFQISDFNLRDYEEWSNLYKEFNNTPSYFEIWVIPTISNPTNDIFDKLKNEQNAQIKQYLNMLIENVPDKNIRTKSLFLLVNKKNSEIVTKKFKELSFGLRNISSDEVRLSEGFL